MKHEREGTNGSPSKQWSDWQAANGRVVDLNPYLDGQELSFVEEGDPLYEWLTGDGLLNPVYSLGTAGWSMRPATFWSFGGNFGPDLWDLSVAFGAPLSPSIQLIRASIATQSGLRVYSLLMRRSDESRLREIMAARDLWTSWGIEIPDDK